MTRTLSRPSRIHPRTQGCWSRSRHGRSRGLPSAEEPTVHGAFAVVAMNAMAVSESGVLAGINEWEI